MLRHAVSESFFATYKKELLHTRPWPTITDLKERRKDCVDNYYNGKAPPLLSRILDTRRIRARIQIPQSTGSLSRSP